MKQSYDVLKPSPKTELKKLEAAVSSLPEEAKKLKLRINQAWIRRIGC